MIFESLESCLDLRVFQKKENYIKYDSNLKAEEVFTEGNDFRVKKLVIKKT